MIETYHSALDPGLRIPGAFDAHAWIGHDGAKWVLLNYRRFGNWNVAPTAKDHPQLEHEGHPEQTSAEQLVFESLQSGVTFVSDRSYWHHTKWYPAWLEAQPDEARARERFVLDSLVRCWMERESLRLRAFSFCRGMFASLQVTLADSLLPAPLWKLEDERIAEIWAGARATNAALVSMYSARAAELMMLMKYRQLYGEATDLSILQLRQSSGEWQFADIQTSTGRIDVKNARAHRGRGIYSEHCISKLKKDREGVDVVISGVLSDCEQWTTDPSRPGIWLGETTAARIAALQEEFNKPYFSVSLARAGRPEHFVPSWLFDFPSICYKERDKKLEDHGLAMTMPTRLPDIFLCALAYSNSSMQSDPRILAEVALLSARFKDLRRLRRGALFLHVLHRFVECIRAGEEFASDVLRQILFPRRDSVERRMPFGMCDPLETIWSLIDLLKRVAIACRDVLAKFKMFRLAGPNIFQGSTDGESWRTIYAYCGGWFNSRRRCGLIPLFLGEHQTCPECLRLACPQCGYCGQGCSACEPRQRRSDG